MKEPQPFPKSTCGNIRPSNANFHPVLQSASLFRLVDCWIIKPIVIMTWNPKLLHANLNHLISGCHNFIFNTKVSTSMFVFEEIYKQTKLPQTHAMPVIYQTIKHCLYLCKVIYQTISTNSSAETQVSRYTCIIQIIYRFFYNFKVNSMIFVGKNFLSRMFK